MDAMQLAILGDKMRTAQKQYFKLARDYNTRPSDKQAALEESKKLEKEFDEATKNIIHKPAIIQPGLF